jgi:hypothetical protein
MLSSRFLFLKIEDDVSDTLSSRFLFCKIEDELGSTQPSIK